MLAKSKRLEAPSDGIVRIKKYANRRLYNTETSAYVTLDDLAEMVRLDREFEVVDAKSGEDLTHSVLTQIILDQEGKGQNLLPVNFLRQLIRFYGDSIGQFVPSYLEISMATLARDQERYRTHLEQAMAGTPLDVFQRQAQQNMELFEKAMSMWVPPYSGGTEESGETKTAEGTGGALSAVNGQHRGEKSETQATATQTPPAKDQDLDDLRSQLAKIQAQLDRMAN